MKKYGIIAAVITIAILAIVFLAGVDRTDYSPVRTEILNTISQPQKAEGPEKIAKKNVITYDAGAKNGVDIIINLKHN